jgi:hypothetical protein
VTASPTNNPTQESSPTPTTTIIPLSEENELYKDLVQKGYRLRLSSGLLVGPGGHIYSAYIFWNPKLTPLEGADSTLETNYVAFYRLDGQKNILLGVKTLPPYFKGNPGTVYPEVAWVVNWDDPLRGRPLTAEFFVEADQRTRQLLDLDDFRSDINQNGLLEFALAVQYWPPGCSAPKSAIQFFEIQSTSSVVNITEGLPGMIDPHHMVHSSQPLNFYVKDGTHIYAYMLEVESSWIFEWDDNRFVDVSARYADEYLAELPPIIQRLEATYGHSWGDPYPWGNPELDVLRILVLYEKAGLRKQGLQKFLEVTDPQTQSTLFNAARF